MSVGASAENPSIEQDSNGSHYGVQWLAPVSLGNAAPAATKLEGPMTRWSEAGRELLGIPGEVVRRHADAKLEEGFNAAADISVELLTKTIDDLMGRMKAGDLSRPEQLLLSSLSELKTEMQQRFFGYWDARAADK